LARLRKLTGDELLVRGRDGMVPTVRAEAMGAPLRRALEDIRWTLSPPPEFDHGPECRLTPAGRENSAAFRAVAWCRRGGRTPTRGKPHGILSCPDGARPWGNNGHKGPHVATIRERDGGACYPSKPMLRDGSSTIRAQSSSTPRGSVIPRFAAPVLGIVRLAPEVLRPLARRPRRLLGS